MKTSTRKSLVLAVILYAVLSGCIKQAGAPDNNPGDGQGHPGILCSDWFGVSFQQVQYIRTADVSVPGISDSLLKYGKVLVFARAEIEQAKALPSAIGGNYIAIGKHVGGLNFVIEGGEAIPGDLAFRYILIPASEIPAESSLNYYDYHAVCAYYKILE